MTDATPAGATLSGDDVDMVDASVPSSGKRDAGRRAALIELVRDRVLSRSAEFAEHGPGLDWSTFSQLPPKRPSVDFLLAAEGDSFDPDDIFRGLRWGGQFVYVARDPSRLPELAERFIRRGFEVEQVPTSFRQPVFGLVLPFLSPRVHYLIVRKVNLTLPKEVSERFTYHVYLSFDRALGRHVVVKEIPSIERVSARLRHKFPDATADVIDRQARKFTEKVFPIFLTREAAMLKLLARDLPETYRGRVPQVVDMDKDANGFVRRLRMTWLRNAPPNGRAMTQLEFARQTADLLRAVHDQAGIIHLDLRLDNMVVTDLGPGFVDFGSAVRVGENIEGNPLLNKIYDELMRTSQIQRMLEKMTGDGTVTSRIFHDAYGKVDKGVDLFYLALQINKPLSNPDFRGLVKFDRRGVEADRLGSLTEEVLKPRDPARPTVRSAADLLAGVDRVAASLTGSAA